MAPWTGWWVHGLGDFPRQNPARYRTSYIQYSNACDSLLFFLAQGVSSRKKTSQLRRRWLYHRTYYTVASFESYGILYTVWSSLPHVCPHLVITWWFTVTQVACSWPGLVSTHTRFMHGSYHHMLNTISHRQLSRGGTQREVHKIFHAGQNTQLLL